MGLCEFTFEQFHQELRAVGIGIPDIILGNVNHAVVEIAEGIELVERRFVSPGIAVEQVADHQELVVDADGGVIEFERGKV